MKDRYKSLNCPICDKSLENSDVVVCPDCGAPYHRGCYLKEQQCIFPELHASGNNWTPPKQSLEMNNKNPNKFPTDKVENTANTCSRCGAINPSVGVFCQICGNKLAPNANNSPKDSSVTPSTSNVDNFPKDKFEPSQNYNPPTSGIPLNSIVNPLGGIAPNEIIDDVSAKEIAVFVGRGSHYYLPKFKEIAQNKGKSINFAAFFFTGGFYLYRKMFLLGALFCSFEFLLSIPTFILLYEQMSAQMLSGTQLMYGNQTVQDLDIICSMLILVLRFVCGYFANSLYKDHVIRKIKETKALNLPESEYFKTLAKSGSVAMGLIRFILFVYLTFNFILLMMMLA